MKKIIMWIVVILGILVGAFFALNSYIYKEKQGPVADYKKIPYIIDNQLIGSAKYFGNEIQVDLNGDGLLDIVGLITNQPGGSGIFYYVVAAIKTENGYSGSKALFLGDRIAPQNIEIGKGKVLVVNYADRAPGEPFSTQPSFGKSMWILFDPAKNEFGEVEKNFEGEANPEIMRLDMKTWTWVSAVYNDGREIFPKKPGKFSLKFSDNGKFSVTTDCNSMGGSYKTDGNLISMTEIFSTLMYCGGSQEGEFANMLENTISFHFTSKGELVFDLKFDNGNVVFK